jgi:hypothetical protein
MAGGVLTLCPSSKPKSHNSENAIALFWFGNRLNWLAPDGSRRTAWRLIACRVAIRANSTGPPCSAALVRSSAAVSTAGAPRSAGGTGRRRGGYEAALYRHIDPHLFAALTFVHAQSAAGSGLQNFESQPGRSATVLAPDFVGGLNVDGNGHPQCSKGRERGGVSLSPIKAKTGR